MKKYKVATFFCGLGAVVVGVLRSRSRSGSRFVSCGAFDVDEVACRDFELLTGAMAQKVDLGAIEPWELARRCEGAPDFVMMSPPCKGYSGCLPESLSKTEKYEAMNRLAYRAVELAVLSWPGQMPKVILLENVPRMASRGAKWLEQIRALLEEHDYEVNLEPHDCGEWGGLAQHRHRLLLVARLRSACPSHLLKPPNIGLRPMSSVLWRLPPPVPGSDAGGPHHRLPRLAPINWLRLAAIPAGHDWRAIPQRVRMVNVELRLHDDGKRHAGKYGPQDPDAPAHAVIAEARTGKAWADVADPRLADRQARQNGGFGVNESGSHSHAVVGEGTVRNTWASVSDPRLDPEATDPRSERPRFADCIRRGPALLADGTVDPRSSCSRFEDSIGVSAVGRPYKTPVIGHQSIDNSPSAVADPRVKPQRRGAYEVLDPARPSATVRGRHDPRVAPSSIADERGLFAPTHELVSAQPWTGDRDAWVRGDFALVGPPVAFSKGARGSYTIIRAPDGTVHRPMTTAELMLLQGIPVWHRPGDPEELDINDPNGQWVQLGGPDATVREHVGNAVPVHTAEAFGNTVLELLDLGAEESFSLSAGGVWVRERDAGSVCELW